MEWVQPLAIPSRSELKFGRRICRMMDTRRTDPLASSLVPRKGTHMKKLASRPHGQSAHWCSASAAVAEAQTAYGGGTGSITFTPPNPGPGQTITITITGCTPGETLTITLNGTPIGTVAVRRLQHVDAGIGRRFGLVPNRPAPARPRSPSPRPRQPGTYTVAVTGSQGFSRRGRSRSSPPRPRRPPRRARPPRHRLVRHGHHHRYRHRPAGRRRSACSSSPRCAAASPPPPEQFCTHGSFPAGVAFGRRRCLRRRPCASPALNASAAPWRRRT